MPQEERDTERKSEKATSKEKKHVAAVEHH